VSKIMGGKNSGREKFRIPGGIFEFKITTVKICCVFLDKHRRHILQSYNARKKDFCYQNQQKSTKLNKYADFLSH